MGAVAEAGPGVEVADVAAGARVAVLDVAVLDVGEPAAVTVRVTVAVAAEPCVRVVPEPHPETSAAVPSRQMDKRRLNIVA